MKSGGNLLFQGGAGKHVARQLFDRELIERHIILKCIDHPITIRPDRPHFIFFVSVGVCIPRQV